MEGWKGGRIDRWWTRYLGSRRHPLWSITPIVRRMVHDGCPCKPFPSFPSPLEVLRTSMMHRPSSAPTRLLDQAWTVRARSCATTLDVLHTYLMTYWLASKLPEAGLKSQRSSPQSQQALSSLDVPHTALLVEEPFIGTSTLMRCE